MRRPPLVQTYVRDNLLDTGRVSPSPSNVAHPFDDTQWVYWWQSADVKIDSPDPATNAYAFAGLDIDYLQFEGHAHDNPRRDTWVRAYAQVHTRGTSRRRTCACALSGPMRAPCCRPCPATSGPRFRTPTRRTPTNWHPVGPAKTIASIAPGRPGVVGWSWLVPATAPNHTCLLVVVTSDEDPISVSGTDVGAAVNGSNHVTLKNLHVDNVVPGAQGADSPAGPYMIELGVMAKRAPLDVLFNTRGLPPATVFHIVLPPFTARGGLREALWGFKVVEEIPPTLRELEQFGCREPVDFDWERAFVLETGDERHEERLPGLYGLSPRGERFAAAFVVALPDAHFEEPLTFHVEQWVGGQLAGGSSYELRPVANEEGD